MPGKKRADAAKRDALLRAARKVFHQKGYYETTVAAIASEAGVATGSFYSYFSSKESCFLGLVETLYELLMGAVLRERAKGVDTEAKLIASVRAAVQVFLREPELSRLVLGALQSGQPVLRARVLAIARDLTGLLTADLAELQGASFPWGAAEVRARFLLGGLNWALSEHFTGAGKEDPRLTEEVLLAASQAVVREARGVNESSTRSRSGSREKPPRSLRKAEPHPSS